MSYILIDIQSVQNVLLLPMLPLILLFLYISGFEVQSLSVDAKKLDLPHPCHTPQQLSSVPGSFCASAKKRGIPPNISELWKFTNSPAPRV